MQCLEYGGWKRIVKLEYKFMEPVFVQQNNKNPLDISMHPSQKNVVCRFNISTNILNQSTFQKHFDPIAFFVTIN